MSAGNKMGPEEEGSMTGRGMGYCAGYPQPSFYSAGFRHGGMPMGRRGRRFRHFPYERRSFFRHQQGAMYGPAVDAFDARPITTEEEEQVLSQQASWLQKQLDLINTRLEKIKTNNSAEE